MGSTKSKRICILIESYLPAIGGSETSIKNMTAALSKKGFKFIIITRQLETNLKETDNIDGIPVYRIGPVGKCSFARWKQINPAIKALKKHSDEYDIIFVPGFRTLGLSAIIANKSLKKKCVFRAESQGEMSGEFFRGNTSLPMRIFIAIRNTFLRKSDAFISMSSELCQEFTGNGISKGKVHLIPQGIDTKKFKPVSGDEKKQLRKKLKLPENSKLVIYTGRLVSYKGLPLLLEIWKEICVKDKESVLVLVGAGGADAHNCEDFLRIFVQENRLDDRVIFTGPVDNVDEHLKASDIFVFPTENEAFGISLIEAMGCGLPSIAASVGGIKDIIKDKKNGILIEAANKDQLKQSIEDLLGNEEKCRVLSKNSTETVVKKYSDSVVNQQYIDLFNEL